MKKRILFVDDEVNVLQGLRRMLNPMRHEWDMVFAESGQEALALLAQTPCDVIVSDMRMPGMDGTQLLTQVMERFPLTVRIILSGYADSSMVLKAVGPVHQYLAKPCDAATLQVTVARACALRSLLADPTLQGLVAGMQTLPSLPTLYLEVLETVQDPRGTLERLGEIMSRDIGMTAKMLQLVNSAFFGLRRHVSSPVEAVKLLGLDTIKALVLSLQIFSRFDQKQEGAFSLDVLWQHSLATSTCAKRIAQEEQQERHVADHAFMAGLLHDVGKLVLAANLPELYRAALVQVQEQGTTEWEAERALLGTTHAEVGAYLLGLWGLPDPIVEALAFHHYPSACPDQRFSPLTAVHIANALVHTEDSTEAGGSLAALDSAYVAQLGLSERLATWRPQPCRAA
jgi:HD-like signal output (HDOD) protein/ActR/RegA family two-component response regulator